MIRNAIIASLGLASAAAFAQQNDLTEQARSFLATAESQLSAAEDLTNRADWVRSTYITADTDWLLEKLSTERTALAVSLVTQARRFDGKVRDPEVARKLAILKRLVRMPAAAGSAAALSEVSGSLNTRFATGSFTIEDKRYLLQDAERALAQSRDPVKSAAIWEGWRSVAPPMRDDYAHMVSLANAGARELGFADVGAMWRSEYDVTPEALAREIDALWKQISPLYDELHCYARTKLNARYGDSVQPASGAIRADLTGNMWGQNWTGIWDVLVPTESGATFDLEQALHANSYEPKKMVKAAEGFFVSLGMRSLPESFWARSQFTRPEGRDVDCNASAWTIDQRDDVRIKMCIRVTAAEWPVIHHELGHDYYQLAYQQQPFLFRDGVNGGFHEAIGDFIALSAVTPSYLKRIGLEPADLAERDETSYLLQQALARVPLLAFALAMDKWRWGVFAGEIQPADYNSAWWSLVERYQKLRPPRARPADAFDIAAKYHITANVPYMSYFMASVYQYQFQRAACRIAGVDGPLHRCSIYGSKEVGAKLGEMLASGRSRPTGQTLAMFTGEDRADASAMLDYYAPLYRWLKRQNAGKRCTP
ncbi:M2 family metallopeptidase [Steroidobacter sp.]|uniref:M2 family metallopeptidase n=1 Tax=Steroidobacter sp. TaxID=1978227 RepID=UPI001A39BEC9|nr:M2 family metallopeptidase [Steroidobacter sp.]MBL8268882.1 M2 family metallopeptidase [Steroidobacter sp.]